MNISQSWAPFFNDPDIIRELKNIKNSIGDDYAPDWRYVLRFAETDLSRVKAIILGQDPYPQQGVATGRAFEVQGLYSWQDTFPQSSLRNIVRAVYLAYNNKLITFNAIRREIKSGDFCILPPDKLFESWQAQGVLLLNTTLTCKINSPTTHIKLWESFSNKLLSYIKDNAPRAVWFLWGRFARVYERYAVGGKCFMCAHPMLGGDFFKCGCFAETKELINWKGL